MSIKIIIAMSLFVLFLYIKFPKNKKEIILKDISLFNYIIF